MYGKLKKFFAWDGGFIKGIELLMDLAIILFGFGLSVYVMNELQGGSSLVDAFFEILRLIDEQLNKEVKFPLENIIFLFSVSFSTIMYLFTGFIMLRVYETTLLKRRYVNSIFATFIALLITNVIFVVIVYVFPLSFPYIDGQVFLLAVIIQMILFMLVKYPFWLILKRKLKHNTLVIAKRRDADAIAIKILSDKNTRDRLKYIYLLEDDNITDELINLIDISKTVYISSEFESKVKNKLISYCIGDRSKQVKLVPRMYEISLFNSETKNIDDKLMFKIRPLELTLEQRFLKRSFDILVSGIGLIISFPFLVLAWILIKLDDRGPLFYSQERITLDNKPFKIYKVRSMKVSKSVADNTQAASKNDSRITRVGKFIRASRIDEIPQLWNVFKGEMSLVGPRPLVRKEVEEFTRLSDNFSYRSNVKAGLMGYAQYQGKYTTSFDDKLRLDLLYIRNQSFLLDIKIIFATVLTVLDRDASAGIGANPTLEDVLERKNLAYVHQGVHVLKIVRPEK